MLEIIKDTLMDGIKLLPFLFITYVIMEYIEHKTKNKTKEAIKKSGKFGPIIGSLLGTFPQCGFSVSATNLYSARVITLAEYRFVADTEKPHCGKVPNKLPIIGPNFPDFFIASFVLFLVLCSIYSIITYVINKKGSSFIPSINVSFIISNMLFLLFL